MTETTDMSEAKKPTDASETATPRRSDLVIIVFAFVMLYAYDMLEAITNLQQLPQLYMLYGIAASTPWWLLIAGVALPPVLFALATALGRGRAIVARAGILLIGLGVSAGLSLLLEAIARVTAAAALS